jgi:hypothetical protein
MQLLFDKMTFFSFTAVARLGIADHLSETPRDIEDIARDTATHAPSLYRVLRLLVSVGLFKEGPLRHFALNPAAQLLQSGHPRSMRAMAIMFSDNWQIQSYAQMDECIRTGTDGVTLEFGKHVFDLFHDIPDQAANFHRAMTSFSGAAAAALLEVADFSRFRRLPIAAEGTACYLAGFWRSSPTFMAFYSIFPRWFRALPPPAIFATRKAALRLNRAAFSNVSRRAATPT